MYNHHCTLVQRTFARLCNALFYRRAIEGDEMAKLTGAACRAGRALLKWSMRDLVEASGVSLPTVLKLENDGSVSEETAEKIRAAFERQAVEITNGDGTGARLRFREDRQT
jgi:predicted transcriptional regulator